MKKVVVYDRLDDKRIISRHKNYELTEKAAKKRGCGDRYGLCTAEDVIVAQAATIRELQELVLRLMDDQWQNGRGGEDK
jgi:hypothetical protein